MRILLIDADGDFPNLALMKLSSHHKYQGDKVYFGSCKNPDIVYISCVFTWNNEKALQASAFYPNAKIIYGGTGFNLDSLLPTEIEHLRPDYSLYDLDYSVGFATRGCIRSCPWCIVPEKEGNIHHGSPLSEFVDPLLKKILLLDNNLLTHPDHLEILNEIILLDKKTSFAQGLDIRLINNLNAELLSKIKYYDIRFKNRRLHFAWDDPKLEKTRSQRNRDSFDLGGSAQIILCSMFL